MKMRQAPAERGYRVRTRCGCVHEPEIYLHGSSTEIIRWVAGDAWMIAAVIRRSLTERSKNRAEPESGLNTPHIIRLPVVLGRFLCKITQVSTLYCPSKRSLARITSAQGRERHLPCPTGTPSHSTLMTVTASTSFCSNFMRNVLK